MNRCGRRLAAESGHPVEKRSLVAVAQYEVHPFDGGQLFGPKLGIAARDGDDGLRRFAVKPSNQVAALLLGMFRHGTCIYHAYVRFGGVTDGRIAALFELPRDGGGFGEVQLAAQRMETDFFGEGIFISSVSECEVTKKAVKREIKAPPVAVVRIAGDFP